MKKTALEQYAVYSDCSHYVPILEWIQARGLKHEIHLNRIRFTIESGTATYTEFLLRWRHYCPNVTTEEELMNQLAEQIRQQIDDEIIQKIIDLENVRKSRINS